MLVVDLLGFICRLFLKHFWCYFDIVHLDAVDPHVEVLFVVYFRLEIFGLEADVDEVWYE